jgi:hypothetical protein
MTRMEAALVSLHVRSTSVRPSVRATGNAERVVEPVVNGDSPHELVVGDGP